MVVMLAPPSELDALPPSVVGPPLPSAVPSVLALPAVLDPTVPTLVSPLLLPTSPLLESPPPLVPSLLEPWSPLLVVSLVVAVLLLLLLLELASLLPPVLLLPVSLPSLVDSDVGSPELELVDAAAPPGSEHAAATNTTANPTSRNPTIIGHG